MIISRRPAASVYSVDPIALSLGSSLAASVRIVSRPDVAPVKMNLALLYPSLFVSASRVAKKAA